MHNKVSISFLNITLISLTMLFITACYEEPEYPTVPSISGVELAFQDNVNGNQDAKLTISFSYRDNEGDIFQFRQPRKRFFRIGSEFLVATSTIDPGKIGIERIKVDSVTYPTSLSFDTTHIIVNSVEEILDNFDCLDIFEASYVGREFNQGEGFLTSPGKDVINLFITLYKKSNGILEVISKENLNFVGTEGFQCFPDVLIPTIIPEFNFSGPFQNSKEGTIKYEFKTEDASLQAILIDSIVAEVQIIDLAGNRSNTAQSEPYLFEFEINN